MQQTGGKAPGCVRPRAALILALVLAAAVGPVWLAPAGAAGAVISTDITPLGGEVVSSAMIPLNGRVSGVSLSGVVHVVTQVGVGPGPHGMLTVNAYLTPIDITFTEQALDDFFAHGAGTAVIPVPDGEAIKVGTVVITGFFLNLLYVSAQLPWW